MTEPIHVSFIIPTFNEECMLLNTLQCIEAHKPKSLSCEIIVADNGSKDNTVEIAKKYAQQVLVDESATVGGLRNLAVKSSKGKVLVFLDADVLLTDKWRENFLAVYEDLLINPFQITGSRCAIPNSASWIERVWFKSLVSLPSNYINSGHLITTKELFDHIGGFNPALVTGEDYELGVTARAANAAIFDNSLLMVVHEGYPKTIGSFVKREIWHGKGDCESIKKIMASKVALVGFTFFILHLVLLLSILKQYYFIFAASVLLIVVVCLAVAILKHKTRRMGDTLQVGFLYYLYFCSRFLSCFSLLGKRLYR